MRFDWETEEERMADFMKIPPFKKLEWLHEMHKFALRLYSKQRKKLFWRLRESQQS
jgi:hypothetical protein